MQGYKLVLYSGGDSGHYGTINLSGTIQDEGNTGYGAVNFDIPLNSIETGLQNGPNDGIGLVNPDNECAEFFSYEGDLTANAGTGAGGGSACDGQEGVDIGVFEQNSSENDSLQRTGQGFYANDFAWVGPVTASGGFINNEQVFDDPAPTPEPTPAPETFLFNKAVLVGSVATPFYDRDADYPTWDDTDGDCISNRHEVLIAQHIDDDTSNPLVYSSSGCTVISGKWNDPFDNSTYYSASQVQIDHVVALYESHISGAGNWDSAEEKRTYANTGNKNAGTLPETTHQFLAVGGSSNGAKGSSDPTEWMPSNTDFHCTYLKKWVEVKHLNDLYFDQNEYDFIKNEESNCDNSELPVLPPNDDSTPAPTPAPGDGPEAGTVFINELNYDMVGVDADEYIEIAGPAGTDLSGWKLELYNGNNDEQYGQGNLSGVLEDESGGYGFAAFDFGQIQNGEADGIGLVDPSGTCVELISYEGTMSPISGSCSDFTATDIGVSQSNSTSADESLQKTGSGSESSDFSWVGPVAKTKGSVNADQTFESANTTYVVTASGLDYLIDGVMHASITLKRGVTYTFDVSDFGNAHPFRFSTTQDGTFGGGTAFNDGVTYVDEGTITWTVPENLSASVMYYYCTIHAGMAGSGVISITD